MRLGDKSLEFIVNFLLGVSWALIVIGALSAFVNYYSYSFGIMIVYTFVGMLPGVFALVLLEHIIVSKEKFIELKKQTRILEALQAKES